MKNTLKIWAVTMTLIATAIPAKAYKYPTRDGLSYILEKTAVHDIVFMGTTHKQPAILDFIADLLPGLHATGITHIAIEVASDQQGRIDHYLASGKGLADISLHRSIECPRYRRLFRILRGIDNSRRPKVVAIDLPTQQYDGPINRDTYMAATLNKTLRSNPDGKILVVLGSFHVLRELHWQKRISNGHQAIRSLLAEQYPDLKMFSTAHILSWMDTDCDFGRRLGPVSGTAALDINPRFDTWHLGLTACLAIKPAPARRILDGVIVH